jgi:hypothetical protein
MTNIPITTKSVQAVEPILLSKIASDGSEYMSTNDGMALL